MANRERGVLVLDLGGKSLTIELSLNACAELEDFAPGDNIDAVVRRLTTTGSIKALRLFLWTALRKHHPDIATDDRASLKVIGDLVDAAGGLDEIVKQIKAFVKMNEDPTPEAAGSRPIEAAPAEGGAAPPSGNGDPSSTRRSPSV